MSYDLRRQAHATDADGMGSWWWPGIDTWDSQGWETENQILYFGKNPAYFSTGFWPVTATNCYFQGR